MTDARSLWNRRRMPPPALPPGKPATGDPGPPAERAGRAGRWDVVRDALVSWPATARFCLIILVTSIPPGALAWLIARR